MERCGANKLGASGGAAAVARAIVVALLAVFLGAGTSLEALHFEFAHHGHRYCPEHQQVEAIEPDAAGGHDLARRDATEGPVAETGTDGLLHTHIVCAFLNALAARGPTVSASHSHDAFFRFDAAVFTASAPRESARSIALIRVAPKTSPPAVTA